MNSQLAVMPIKAVDTTGHLERRSCDGYGKSSLRICEREKMAVYSCDGIAWK